MHNYLWCCPSLARMAKNAVIVGEVGFAECGGETMHQLRYLVHRHAISSVKCNGIQNGAELEMPAVR